jgi:hypothetical protein
MTPRAPASQRASSGYGRRIELEAQRIRETWAAILAGVAISEASPRTSRCW